MQVYLIWKSIERARRLQQVAGVPVAISRKMKTHIEDVPSCFTTLEALFLVAVELCGGKLSGCTC